MRKFKKNNFFIFADDTYLFDLSFIGQQDLLKTSLHNMSRNKKFYLIVVKHLECCVNKIALKLCQTWHPCL